ncbi:MAG: hypothetical protein ACYDBQ_08080 [Thermoplasmatota archaeon]
MRVWVALVVLAVALGGCTSNHKAVRAFACPDGTVIDLNQFPDSADPASNCPVAPFVTLSVAPTVAAYAGAFVSWRLHNGTFGTAADPAHSMLSEIRVSNVSVPALAGPSSYGYEVVALEHQHQNLPAAFNGTLPGFSAPGVHYVRAYMQVHATGWHNMNETDVWSPEATLTVTPVVATGVRHFVNHTAGGPEGTFGPTPLAIHLGDSVLFSNQDAFTHNYNWTAVPAQCHAPAPAFSVASMATSSAMEMACPGTYTVSVDEPGSAAESTLSKTAQVTVS